MTFQPSSERSTRVPRVHRTGSPSTVLNLEGERVVRGLMQNQPLLLSSLLQHADRFHSNTEIVSRTVESPIHRYTYKHAARRARKLADALQRRGVGQSDRVGTLAL